MLQSAPLAVHSTCDTSGSTDTAAHGSSRVLYQCCAAVTCRQRLGAQAGSSMKVHVLTSHNWQAGVFSSIARCTTTPQADQTDQPEELAIRRFIGVLRHDTKTISSSGSGNFFSACDGDEDQIRVYRDSERPDEFLWVCGATSSALFSGSHRSSPVLWPISNFRALRRFLLKIGGRV